MKYIVTGINKLTGEREAISNPHSEWKAHELLARWKGKNRNTRPYKQIRVEPAEQEGNLW